MSLPSVDQENDRDDVRTGCEELVGIPEATYGATKQRRPRQVLGYRVDDEQSQPRHLDQRLGSENVDDVAVGGREEITARHRAKGQRQAGQETAEATAKSAHFERRAEKSAQLQDLVP